MSTTPTIPDLLLRRWRELLQQAETARLAAEMYIAGVVDALGVDRARVVSIDPVTGAIALKDEGGEQ